MCPEYQGSVRTLFHFEHSVFSRRTRLALAHKGLTVELKEGRADASNLEASRKLQPLRTMPVFVEEDGQALGDSSAIVQYLDVAYRDNPLLPTDAKAARDALAIMTAVDVAMNAVVDCGTRLFELRNDPAWAEMKEERMARAHEAIDFVATRTTRPYLAGDAWSAADIWVYSATRWVDAWPVRVETSPQVAKMITLGFKLPAALVSWSKQHDSRADVRSIYG